MLRPRIIPCLLLLHGSLVKTIGFDRPTYIGDPINTIHIYNEMEVDELIFLDITATVERRSPPYEVLRQIASECFMPVAYGGGIGDVETIRRVLELGIEKVVINSHAAERPEFIAAAAAEYGSQAIVGGVDVRQTIDGRYEVYSHGGRRATGREAVEYAAELERRGVGELMITSIDRDGTMQGYDLLLVRNVASAVGVPVVAAGGAGSLADVRAVVKDAGAAAAAAGAMLVYFGRNRAVLINYPDRTEIDQALR